MSEKIEYTARYEHNGEFWYAEIKRNVVTVHFGKIGTIGHAASREFGSIEAAKEFVKKRLASKIAQGFVKVSDSPQ